MILDTDSAVIVSLAEHAMGTTLEDVGLQVSHLSPMCKLTSYIRIDIQYSVVHLRA